MAAFLASPHRRAHETVEQVLQRAFREQCSQDVRDVEPLASKWPRLFDVNEEAEEENRQIELANKKYLVAKPRQMVILGTYEKLRKYFDAAANVANKAKHLGWIVGQVHLIVEEEALRVQSLGCGGRGVESQDDSSDKMDKGRGQLAKEGGRNVLRSSVLERIRMQRKVAQGRVWKRHQVAPRATRT